MIISSNGMPSGMSDLLKFIEDEIPEGRQSLKDNHVNLEKVAEYCESNYFQAENKKDALEETKNYCTQSLASVAYQINTLAYNLVHMLDLQTSQLDEMESQINHIAQSVNIHKEKVARREIGILTTNKAVSHQHKILVPANPEKQMKYIRKPIDYTVLDDIGHGVKVTTTPKTVKRASVQEQVNGLGNPYMHYAPSGPAPTTKPPTPPQTVRGIGSLSRASKEYRTPAPPIAPPQVPSNYAPNYPLGHPRAQDSAKRGSGYSTLPMSMAHHHAAGHVNAANAAHQMNAHVRNEPLYQHQNAHQQQQQQNQPQVGMVHPLPHTINKSLPGNFIVPPSPTPPPPPPPPVQHHHISSPVNDLPEPPMHLQHTPHGAHVEIPGNVSPPLPPPPPTLDEHPYNSNQHMLMADDDDDWVPKEFIEKVVAIYDYSADKEDELTFNEGSIIYVIKKNDDGWYEGLMDGLTGLFPGNYVESIN